jgi:hypothetical protein
MVAINSSWFTRMGVDNPIRAQRVARRLTRAVSRNRRVLRRRGAHPSQANNIPAAKASDMCEQALRAMESEARARSRVAG